MEGDHNNNYIESTARSIPNVVKAVALKQRKLNVIKLWAWRYAL